MYLFLDTETTGLPKNYNAPISNLSNWPRLVQIAWLKYSESGDLIESKNYIIKPNGFTIPTSSIQVHGITNEKAVESGVDLKSTLEEFSQVLSISKYIIAHNLDFDEKIIGAELLRNNMPNPFSGVKKICLMKTSTNFCKIPGPYGYKWPSLSELYYTLFKTGFEEAHNAKVDVQACAKCFFQLKKINAILL